MVFQYITSLIGLLAILQGYSQYKRGQQNLRVFIFWSFAWISMLAIVIFPQVTNYLSQLLKLSRPVDAVLYPSIVILYYLIFTLYTKIERYNKELTRMVRSEAIRNVKNKVQ